MSLARSDPPPHWFWVAVGVGFAAGLTSVGVGCLLAVLGGPLNLQACQNDAGCLGLFAGGLFAAPFCVAGGGLVAGLVAADGSRRGNHTPGMIWKRSFGFGFLASLFSAVVGLVALGAIHR